MAPAQKSVQRSSRTATGKRSPTFTEEEHAAMRERVKELRAGNQDGESLVLEKIASMTGQDKAMGNRLHAIIKASAPSLTPRLWYGMPAYAKNDKVVCWFQPATKFKTRYAMLGFSDKANLDEGSIWPVAYALKVLTAAEESKVSALVKRAAS